jgi:hypothetical protein
MSGASSRAHQRFEMREQMRLGLFGVPVRALDLVQQRTDRRRERPPVRDARTRLVAVPALVGNAR